MSKTESRRLTTPISVLEKLGGVRPVSALTGAGYKIVFDWQKADRFPARYYLVMTHALRSKGYSAPPELWGQVTPAERKAAIQAVIDTTIDKQRRKLAS